MRALGDKSLINIGGKELRGINQESYTEPRTNLSRELIEYFETAMYQNYPMSLVRKDIEHIVTNFLRQSRQETEELLEVNSQEYEDSIEDMEADMRFLEAQNRLLENKNKILVNKLHELGVSIEGTNQDD